MKSEIKKTVIDIVSILSNNDEHSWARTFEKLGSELDVDYEQALDALKGLYGGMGSFNDIILHKDGMPLMKENDELDNLRHILYNQLKSEINAL
ncbi:hypothetical protein D1V04_11965 [Salmonella enterica]|nr:hypothetical protein [Salmonella enterica subsp. arizonae serovar 63:z36:-]EAX0034765.1 hypothetical protein [Salmonella enterica]EBH9978822.1 hypothetical protein [Salmonella enterica subsp. arizonae serovar 40:z36:-]EEJ3488456.1 hypothetical protein [Salmonella enterica subsp. arizonae serovar 56:z4,z23:-]EJU7780472.1 hypothetical protein [Salmonella enterica subsp. arizonae serovar 56:z36:-]SUG25965.1 Uncharacterised protein [Salmonella enterica subsp. arizonae]